MELSLQESSHDTQLIHLDNLRLSPDGRIAIWPREHHSNRSGDAKEGVYHCKFAQFFLVHLGFEGMVVAERLRRTLIDCKEILKYKSL